jgi:hypothetical protein
VAGPDDERREGGAQMDWQRHLIRSYLQTHPGYVCVGCLAQYIDVPAGQISMLRHQLVGLEVQMGICSRCRSTQIVMKSA